MHGIPNHHKYSKSRIFFVYQLHSDLINKMEIILDPLDFNQLPQRNTRNMASMTKKQHNVQKNEEDYTNSASARNLVKKDQMQNGNNNTEQPHQSKLITQIKKNDFVRLFIDRIKRNDSKYLDIQNINNKYIDAMRKINDDIEGTNKTKIKGIHVKGFIKLLITFLIVVTILTVHLLSTFRWFFGHQRNTYADRQRQMGFKIFCLVCSCIKIFSSFTFCINVLGKNLIFLKDIAVHYVSNTDFYLDLLVLISTLMLMIFDGSEAVGIFGYFATLANLAYIERMEEAIDVILNTTTKKQLFALARLLFANILIAHLIATIMLLMTYVNDNGNWMTRFGISDYAWWEKYFYSIYWASTVTTTVGFGDILSSNVGETIVITAVMLFGCLVLSYNINQVANIISNLSSSNLEIKNKLAVLKKLARIRKIDFRLHKEIGEYIIHATEIKRNFEFQEGDELISSLPTHIQEDFAAQSAHKFFAPLPFFFIISNQTKKVIYAMLKLEVLSPKQYITHKRIGLTKIYILRMGETGFAYKKYGSSLNGTILDSIQVKNETKDPEIFNIYLLTRGKQLQYDIICKEYCVVSTLQFQDFYEALRTQQKYNEFFHQSMDAVHFENNQWGRTKCEYCNIKHSIFVCPKLHFMPLRSITYMKHRRRISKIKFHSDLAGLVQNVKAHIGKVSSLKLYNNEFASLQEKQGVNEIKKTEKKIGSMELINQELGFLKDWVYLTYLNHEQEIFQYFEVDCPKDYQTYFPVYNSGSFKQKMLKTSKSQSIDQMQFD